MSKDTTNEFENPYETQTSIEDVIDMVLWGEAAGRCAICEMNLCQNIDVAVNAHIAGKNPTSPRYNPSMTDKERNDPCNFILLCEDDRAKIDRVPKYYTVERLHRIKQQHIERVNKAFEPKCLIKGGSFGPF